MGPVDNSNVETAVLNLIALIQLCIANIATVVCVDGSGRLELGGNLSIAQI